MAELLKSLKLGDVELYNRIGLAPMCTYTAAEDGVPTDWHLVHYGARVLGGSSLIITEATAVDERGRISPGDVGLWDDCQVSAWRPITRFIREHGSVPCVQLAHAGRKSGSHTPFTGRGPVGSDDWSWPRVSSSALAFNDSWPVPKEMSAHDLHEEVRRWAHAASRAYEAGFTAIELHMAHGYLLHQFLSPLSNKRTDDYGGSLKNRIRFPLMVAEAVRKVWPDNLPLIVRISATDWVKDGGWTLKDSVALVKALKGAGVTLVDCSSGGIAPLGDATGVEIPVGPGFQVHLAAEIRAKCGIPTAAVGLITDAQQAEEIVASGKADVVLLGRELLRNPHWPLQAASQLDNDYEWPVQYARAKIELKKTSAI